LRRILLGPFSDVYRRGGLLFFKAPEEYRARILEGPLKPGLTVSPDRIVRAYKDGLCRYWILVEYERGYDLYKHFRLASMRGAWRVPRITVEACPICGEDLVDGYCLECGEGVERPKHVEVWRDPEAREELMPLLAASRDQAGLTIRSRNLKKRIERKLTRLAGSWSR